MTMRMTATLAAMGLALGMASAGSASAAIIYEDNFDGDSNSLNGAAPDTRPGTEVWTAGSGFERDGSAPHTRRSAYLPFEPLTGNIYKLTATFSVVQSRITIGFSELQNVFQNFGNSTVKGYATGVLTYDGDNENYDIDAQTGVQGSGSSNLADGVTLAQDDVTFEITLDATGASSSNWTAAWSVTDGTTTWTRAAATATSGSYGDINYLVFTSGTSSTATGEAGTLEYLKLETVIPEPASMVLMAIGSTLMLVRSRR